MGTLEFGTCSQTVNRSCHIYQSYTLQHRIGKSLNKEPDNLVQYYKTGQQENGYKGYSTNYQDLDIDIYKIELWKLIKEVLRLLDYDIQKLEDQIFPTIIEEDDNCDTTLSNTINNSRASTKMTLIIIGKQRIFKEMNHWINIKEF